MTFSKLCRYVKISPNTYGVRTHKIDTITIHCYVGQVSLKNGVDCFSKKGYKWSCNYLMSKTGEVGGVLPEEYASKCSSNKPNDERAITIETACDAFYPYKIYDVVYEGLVNLCYDICVRNGIEKLVWSKTKKDRVGHLNGCNLTVHRDYAAKSCPGDYIYNNMQKLADRVNSMLAGAPNVTNDGLGIQEHSKLGKINFNELDYSKIYDFKFYRNRYSDLTQNGLKTEAQFFTHFKLKGMIEGRQANCKFNPIAYKSYNKDLADLFGNDYKWYYAHYCLIGHKEERRCL